MDMSRLFHNLSPLDHRYYLANSELFEKLSLYLSEEAGVRYCLKVEITLLVSLINQCENLKRFRHLVERLEELPQSIPAEQIYEEESRTRHNIRALVNVLKRTVPGEIGHLVHLGATSADILDTSTAMRIRDAVRRVVLPLLIELQFSLIELTLREAETPQIGRTHGQHAVPLTCGYAFSEYVSRLGKSIERMDRKSRNLRGKLAGAVGAYNATALIVEDPEELEREFLYRLDLKASEHSTQIVEPEYLLELLLEINTAFGIIANLADDLRNLQRSEIGELRERFTATQVGSSTMPQKRNPWNSEHVKSLWKAFAPRVVTFFMDQISEHQRDLTNSASSRFVADFISGFAAAANRMKTVLNGLSVERDRMKANLCAGGDLILAEALYILLAMAGETDAHEVLRKLTLEAESGGSSLLEALRTQPEVFDRLEELLKENSKVSLDEFCAHPELYRGIAVSKAKAIAMKYRDAMQALAEALEGGE
jgi:adenylosuccinate lyase